MITTYFAIWRQRKRLYFSGADRVFHGHERIHGFKKREPAPTSHNERRRYIAINACRLSLRFHNRNQWDDHKFWAERKA